MAGPRKSGVFQCAFCGTTRSSIGKMRKHIDKCKKRTTGQ